MNRLPAALVLGCALATAAGCARDLPKPTFNKDIAPIVYANCAACHRPAGAAPFSLLTYADVSSRAENVAHQTLSRHMPPWLPERGEFPIVGDRRLSPEQIDVIQRWVKEGRAEGAASDRPPAPVFPDGWELGRPDAVLTFAKPYTLKPDQPDVYRNFVLRTSLASGAFVRAVEFRTNGAPVHHAVSVRRFANADGAHRIEPLSETARETGRHVLHDEHRGRERPREVRHDRRQGAGPTGRTRDRYCRRGRRKRGYAARRRRGRRRPEHAQSERIRVGRGAQCLEQPRGDRPHVAADRSRRLEHKIHGAQFQCPQGDFGTGRSGRGAEHHDRARCLAHDVPERVEAVQLRHVHVERDDVGIENLNLLQRVVPVARGAGNLELPRVGDDLGDDRAHERTVIDDEDARHARGHACPCAAIAPRRGRRPR